MRVIILKLGGSVLASEACLPRAVHEVYRWRREGYGVVAVVSAFAGETDRLLAEARERGASASSTAAIAALGELRSAAFLAAALDRAGVPNSVVSAAALALRTEGEPLAAAPIALDRTPLDAALAAEGVVVVPGFAGVDRRGRATLFGRGGSDLSALFLAHALGARCRLIKDVDGLYERDPALAGPPPRRHARASFDDALATDGTIVQHAAVRCARARDVSFEIARWNGVRATRVGRGATAWASPRETPPPLRVVLLGLGTVGGGVWKLSREFTELDVVAVACRDARRAEALGVPRERIHADPLDAVGVDADVVVECLGGVEPARTALATALASGRDVVTANKRVLAEHGERLRELASANGVSLACSAAVGGSAPVLERVHARASEGALIGVRGSLSGTVNFVLERVALGAELAHAVDEARALGLAEEDAARDLDGRDVADKLRVIVGELRVRVVALERESLDASVVTRAREARARGACVRQVATLRFESDGAHGSVRFEELAPEDALFTVLGAGNAAVLLGPDGPLERIAGIGAGAWPTAESVLADLASLSRAREDARSPASLAS